MTLPLYKDIHNNPPDLDLYSNSCNYGLLFERYFSGYDNSYQKTKIKVNGIEKDTFTQWLEKFHNKKIGVAQKETLDARAISLRLLAESQHGRAGVFLVDGQFVTGMGLPHPIENGFLWHKILGMPYIPGSIVKGIVRSLIETYYSSNNIESQEDILLRWFGSVDKLDNNENQKGSLIFLDALPIKPCSLYVDIMTPHMGNWYEKGGFTPQNGDALPGDWHSPVPISYLVARDLSLQFLILPRASAYVELEQAKSDVDNAWQALNYALEWIGAGAKTAIGFGRMKLDAESEKRICTLVDEIIHNNQKLEHISTLSELGKSLFELENSIKLLSDKNQAGDVQNVEALKRIEEISSLVIDSGSDADKSKLLDIITFGKTSNKLKFSKKRENDFKRLIKSLEI